MTLFFWEHEILKTTDAAAISIVPDINQTLVTIIVTHYNYSEFVETALRSVIAQDHKNFECIILDYSLPDIAG